jgi:ribosomal protein S18 acetylase RimI-like enzyme
MDCCGDLGVVAKYLDAPDPIPDCDHQSFISFLPTRANSGGLSHRLATVSTKPIERGVIAIKASQQDSVLEVGYLRPKRASHEARLKYTIKFLIEDDLKNIMNLQDIVLDNIKDPDTYHPVSKEILKEHLSKDFAIGVVIDENLIGFCIIHLPGFEEGNLGRDIGMSKEDLKKAAHIQFIFVHPSYRGYSIQNKLIKHIHDIVGDMGYCHVLCTISPKNYYSLHNTLQSGFLIREIKEKYDGLHRYILYKNISINFDPSWQDVVTVRSSDIERQKKLLSEDFLGFKVSKVSDEFFIHYGKIGEDQTIRDP